jgi:phage portal protein BeeE
MWQILRRWFQPPEVKQLSLLARSGTAILPEYAPIDALSTMARFPWLIICANAVASDIASTPLTVIATDRRAKKGKGRREPVYGTDAIRLLDTPSPGVTRDQLLVQLGHDRYLTGNAFLWVPGLGAWSRGTGPYPDLAIRCHPQHTRTIPLPLGQVGGYVYTDTTTDTRKEHQIAPEDMIHFRGPSWRDSGLAVLGESVVRCLDDDLRTSIASRELMAQQATSGRPDVIFSAKDAVDPKSSQAILDRYAAAVGKNGVGALVVGNGVEATPVSWSPKEFPFTEREEKIRDDILALFEVTPARAGVASANYGTDRQQARTYWSSIVRRSNEWAQGLSRLCPRGQSIEHDFSGVEALQVSYTERLARVQAWVAMGATLADAAAYEGFDEAPEAVNPPATAAPAPGGSVAPPTESEDGYQGDRRGLADSKIAWYATGKGAA